MSDKKFSLMKRGKYWYCRFKKNDGSYGTAISTKQTNKGNAEAWAIDNLSLSGIVGSKTLLKTLGDQMFQVGSDWSKYKQLISNRTVTPVYLSMMNGVYKNQVKPTFGEMKFKDVNRHVIRDYTVKMKDKNYSYAHIKQSLQVLRHVLDYAIELGYISQLPQIPKIPRDQTRKGVLTLSEIKQVFSSQWTDYRAYIANMIACFTGMRHSEIMCLTPADVDINSHLILVNKNWNYRMSYCTPRTKSGKPRIVPIPEFLTDHIIRLIEQNPHQPITPDSLIFYSRRINKPMDKEFTNEALYEVCSKLGINCKARKISFHSWRHAINSQFINSGINLVRVQQVIGHSSDELSKHYLHTGKEFSDFRKVQDQMLIDIKKG